MPIVEKKSKVSDRHRRVAGRFAVWTKSHPKATRQEKIQKLDQLSDYEYLADSVKGRR
jgi:hypothetical protein